MIAIRLLVAVRWSLAAVLALMLLLAAAWPGAGQTLAPRADVLEARSLVARPSAARPAQAQPQPQVYIPLVVAQPQVIIQFGTGVDDQDRLLNPGTVFTYGIARLYYQYVVAGAAGRPYRTEWFVDGARQPLLDDSGTIPQAVLALFTNSFCSPTLGNCDQPVPRAVYQVNLYIDDALYRQATAVIQ